MVINGIDYRLTMDWSLTRDGRLIPYESAVEILSASKDPKAKEWLTLIKVKAPTKKEGGVRRRISEDKRWPTYTVSD